MKKLLLFLTLISVFNFSNAYSQEEATEDIKHMIQLQVRPEYPGPGSFQQYVMNYVIKDGFRKSHRTYVDFIVEKDGSLSNVTFPEGTDKKVQRSILAAFKSSKKWKPGMQDGEAVRVSYRLPIIIKIKY